MRQPLESVVVRLAGGLLGPSVRDLVPGDSFVHGALADLDLDSRLSLT